MAKGFVYLQADLRVLGVKRDDYAQCGSLNVWSPSRSENPSCGCEAAPLQAKRRSSVSRCYLWKIGRAFLNIGHCEEMMQTVGKRWKEGEDREEEKDSSLIVPSAQRTDRHIQRSAKRFANLAKQDPGRARQNR